MKIITVNVKYIAYVEKEREIKNDLNSQHLSWSVLWDRTPIVQRCTFKLTELQTCIQLDLTRMLQNTSEKIPSDDMLTVHVGCRVEICGTIKRSH